MLVAANMQGERILSVSSDSERLRLMSRIGDLYCPSCRKQVIFRHGSVKAPHFAHRQGECTYAYHEPETEEHILGKLRLYERLRQLYPHSMVELEWWINTTNQRADVFITHPNGERWAIEFQCTKITGKVWEERHMLYHKSGVKDIWVLGDSVHSYATTNKMPDPLRHRFCHLEKTLLEKQGHLTYLDPTTNTLRILWNSTIYPDLKSGNVYLRSFKPYIVIREHTSPLDASYLSKYRWWTDDMTRFESHEREKKNAYENKILPRQEAEETRKSLVQYFSACMAERDLFLENMTDIEKNTFSGLCRAHGWNRDTFPGVLHVRVQNEESIETPKQLWQLWIYHHFVHGNKGANCIEGADWVVQELYDLEDFRIRSFDKVAIYSFLKILSFTGVISFLERGTFTINVNKIPTFFPACREYTH